MSTYETIDVEAFRRLKEAGEADQVWNVLTDDYFTGEMIPGSRRVPLGAVVREARSLELDEDATVVVYCSGGDCPQSGLAAEKLDGMGYDVVDFEGGIEAWRDAGLPLEAADAVPRARPSSNPPAPPGPPRSGAPAGCPGGRPR